MKKINLVLDIACQVAWHLQRLVLPVLGQPRGKEITGKAKSGDCTFALDEIAEQGLAEYIKEKQLPVAVYSEDRGLVKFKENPEYILIVDPIDGTRPAKAGLDMCCVCAAVVEYSENPVLGDILAAAVKEIRGDQLFYASLDQPTVMAQINDCVFPKWQEGTLTTASLSNCESVEFMAWGFEMAGRPIEIVSQSLKGIFNLSSLSGGCYVFNSSSYALTRILTGQLDAYIDPVAAWLKYPENRPLFEKAGRGEIIGLFPYDFAATVFLLQQAGALITDVYGNSLDKIPLLEAGGEKVYTLVAAGNKILHNKILSYINLPDVSV